MTYERIVLFGRPGSGKSTFATKLGQALRLPVFHLDKYFFDANWVERPKKDFLADVDRLVEEDRWIIDGNSLKYAMHTRLQRAQIAVCFMQPFHVCLWRIIKRRFFPNNFDDRAKGCDEKVTRMLIEYTWSYPERIRDMEECILPLYPKLPFFICQNEADLADVERILTTNETEG